MAVAQPSAARKSVKAKTASGPKKTRVHPPYVEMIKEAIVALKERTGSSHYAIAKFIEDKQKANLPPNFKKMLFVQLKKFVASGKLVKVKNSFKLPAATKAPEAKAPAKKKVAAKPKAATPVKAKKVAPKPKAASKPKKVAKTATVVSPGKKKVATPAAVKVKKKVATPAAVKVKKTPAKAVRKPKSIKSPAKKKAPAKKVKK